MLCKHTKPGKRHRSERPGESLGMSRHKAFRRRRAAHCIVTGRHWPHVACLRSNPRVNDTLGLFTIVLFHPDSYCARPPVPLRSLPLLRQRPSHPFLHHCFLPSRGALSITFARPISSASRFCCRRPTALTAPDLQSARFSLVRCIASLQFRLLHRHVDARERHARDILSPGRMRQLSALTVVIPRPAAQNECASTSR